MRDRTNAIAEAVEVLGGVERVAVAVEVRSATVYKWLQAAAIPRSRDLIAMAEALVAAGHPIALRRLAGLEGAGPLGPVERRGRAASRGRITRSSADMTAAAVNA